MNLEREGKEKGARGTATYLVLTGPPPLHIFIQPNQVLPLLQLSNVQSDPTRALEPQQTRDPSLVRHGLGHTDLEGVPDELPELGVLGGVVLGCLGEEVERLLNEGSLELIDEFGGGEVGSGDG
jgi:hypothetical protein